MPVTAIIGGQFGSEGKGKISAYLARNAEHAVRTGGPNAGHTVVEGGQTVVLRHLPAAAVRREIKLYLGAGAVIDPEILLTEIRENDITPDRLVIDRQAVVITEGHTSAEAELVQRIGSTGKGVGAAVASKIWRDAKVVLAGEVEPLQDFCGDVAAMLHKAIANNERVLLEGTQGTGLSLHHGIYPYVTSRDVTAGSLCGEAGIGPTSVDRVVLVVRTYPIRVAGESGPMGEEISWDEVTAQSGYATPIREYTTVTKKLRRVAKFDVESVARATRLNGATEIAITFLDYLDASINGCRDYSVLSKNVSMFVEQMEEAAGVPVTLLGTGPETDNLIDLSGAR
jgi:adenylosuccinate synthase